METLVCKHIFSSLLFRSCFSPTRSILLISSIIVSDDESDTEDPEEQKSQSPSASPATKPKSSLGFFTKYLSSLTGNKVI